MKKIIIIIFYLFLFNKCDDVNQVEEINNEVSVNLILKTDSEKQIALLTYVQNVDNASDNFRFIDKVSLIDSADFSVNDIRFNNIPTDSLKNNSGCSSNYPQIDSCFNYFNNNPGLIKSRLNTLNIKIDKKIITGETILPEDFSIHLEDKKLYWTSSTNAYLYRITAKPKNTKYIELFTKTTLDTTINLDIKNFVPDTYEITVEALDKNLYDFMYNHNTKAGLINAYGVFGSIRIKKIIRHLE